MSWRPETIEGITKALPFYRSCIMVEEQKAIERFEELDIQKVGFNKDGVLIINIPRDKIASFLNLNEQIMRPRRWNEYVGPTTRFYFKMPSGDFRHFVFNKSNPCSIKEAMQIFIPGWDPGDIWVWLASLDVYADLFQEEERSGG